MSARSFCAALLLAGSCASPQVRAVSMRVRCNVPDASVTVDEQYIGAMEYVSRRGVALPPGEHRITIEKVGYFPWDRLVSASDAPIQLDVVLVPIPD